MYKCISAYECICFACACLHSRHPVCEFCKLFRELAVSLYCWWQWKICLTGAAFWWKLISAPFCFGNEKGEETHHARATHLSGCFSPGCLTAAGGKGDVFQIWHVGCWTGNLLLPPHLRPLAGVIPNICVELCAFFCFYPSSSLWLSHPSPCLPNIRASQPACCWEAFLFRLLNFPSSRRFLTGSYTSVPLFPLNSLPGLCAGGMREQRRAVRNHCAGCLTLPYDVFPSSPQLNIAVHFLCRKSEN